MRRGALALAALTLAVAMIGFGAVGTASAICGNSCPGPTDPTFTGYVDISVSNSNSPGGASEGYVTGGGLTSNCTTTCEDSWTTADASAPDVATYTVHPNQYWGATWTGCDSGTGGSSNTCDVTIKYGSAAKTASNTSNVSVTLHDVTAPTGSFSTGLGSYAYSNKPNQTFTFAYDGTGTSASATCALDFGAFGACTSASSYTVSNLADGQHHVTVRITDGAGNVTDLTRYFYIDTVPPAVSVTNPGFANTASPVITFSASDTSLASIQCKLDGATHTCTGYQRDQLSNISQGSHTWAIVATDAAGNQKSQTISFTVDSVAPTLELTGGPADGSTTSQRAPQFVIAASGTGTDVTVSCKLDSGAFAACSSPYAPGTLSDGPHSVTVKALDQAGNETDASRSFTVDTTPPLVDVTAGPVDRSTIGSSSVTFGFSAEPGTALVCDVDGSRHPCTSASSDVVSGLSDGTHTWTVTATDAAGNSTSASRTFSVSTAGSQPTQTSFPSGTTPGAATASARVSRPVVRGTTVTFSVSCKAGGAACAGTAVLAGKTKRLLLGRARYHVAAGGKVKVVVKLSKSAKKLLARSKKLPATLRVTLTGPDGKSTAVLTRKLVFKAPKKKH